MTQATKENILMPINIFLPIVILSVFYSHGINTVIVVYRVIVILTILNMLFVDIRTFLRLNLFLGLATVVGILINGALYFYFVQYDTEGVIVISAALMVAVIYMCVLTFIGYLVKRLLKRRQGGCD